VQEHRHEIAVVKRVIRTIRDRFYIYFTYRNTYRYIDVLPSYVKSYNDTVQSTTGRAPSRVTDSDVLTLWKGIEVAWRGNNRESSDVSGGKARSHQQREDAVCQSCRTEFQHGDFEGRQSNR